MRKSQVTKWVGWTPEAKTTVEGVMKENTRHSIMRNEEIN
jgi:hypothetical protein